MPEIAQIFAQALLAGLGGDLRSARPPELDPCANGREFVDRYNLRIDGQAFDWRRYKHVVDVFEDEHDKMVMMAGAQTSKTARLMVKLLRTALVHWGALFGYYFPDFELPRKISRERFAPFVRSNEHLGPWLGRDEQKKSAADQVLTRRFGASTIYFLSTAGRTSTEGMPLKGVFFDEVRRMVAGDIQRAEERTSAQSGPTMMKVSTAYLPETDIHAAFLSGDQRHFHTACRCADGVVLSTTWPNCVVDLRKVSSEYRRKVEHAFTMANVPNLGMTERDRAEYGDAAYVCPRCGEVLPDQREGWWEPHNPGAYVHSYQMPQLLTWTFPAARALAKWNRQSSEPTDTQELYNSMLGLPYVDPDAQPVTMEVMQSNVDMSLVWPIKKGETWIRENIVNAAMGVDVQKGYNVVVIKQLAPNGKFRTIHVDVVGGHGVDQWDETARLMALFDVKICVMDAQPEWSAAFRFAKAFERRVWLAYYSEMEGRPMIDWKDRAKHPPSQKGDESKFKYLVHIHRSKGLHWSLNRWVERVNEVPDPGGLAKRLPRQGGKVQLTPMLEGTQEVVPIVRDVYFVHQTKVVFLRKYANDDARKMDKYTIVAEHMGLDPHFAHANLYCDVALARIGKPAHPRQI